MSDFTVAIRSIHLATPTAPEQGAQPLLSGSADIAILSSLGELELTLPFDHIRGLDGVPAQVLHALARWARHLAEAADLARTGPDNPSP